MNGRTGHVPSAKLPTPKEVRDDHPDHTGHHPTSRRVTANDKLKDGIGIQAFVFWKTKKGTVSATVTDGNGANNSPNTKNLRIREGTKVNLKLCYVDNGVVLKCSRVQVATA